MKQRSLAHLQKRNDALFFLEDGEQKRLEELATLEKEARTQGYATLAGVDEAGRGPLAGPVVAAACVIPDGLLIPGVDDSKKLTPQKRSELFGLITSLSSIAYHTGVVEAGEIDRINILQATIKAMLLAVEGLPHRPDLLLVDGLKLPHPTLPTKSIPKGDQRSHCIATSSIIAKVTRDRLMERYHKEWPQYGFASHKGYGTEKHIAAIRKHGPCPIHRLSFEPVKSLT